MHDWLTHLTSWHWIGFAAVVLILEVLTGTGFLLWIGIAAILVALLGLLIPSMALGIQLITFAIIAILSAVLWRVYLYYHPIKTANPTLNRRAEQYVDQIFTLQSDIVNGMGKLHVDDTMWRIKCGEDLHEGTRVRVIGAEGTILLVEAA